jgi:hypothetical protein
LQNKVGVIEGALSDETLGIDRKPATGFKIEDISVVDVPVQHRDFSGLSQQSGCRHGGPAQDAAMGVRGGCERLKPLLQRKQIRRRRWSRRMQPGHGGADDADRVIIAAVAGERSERACPRRTLQYDRIVRLRHYVGRAFAVPPGHQPAAKPLFLVQRDLQHRGCTADAHRKKRAAAGDQRLAVGRQPPALAMVVEYRALRAH